MPIMTDEMAKKYHCWNHLRTPEQRRDYYQLLRIAGATASQARRWRGWSDPKIKALLLSLPSINKLADAPQSN